MYYTESDIIAKKEPHYQNDIEKLDTYLASLSEEESKKVDGDYIAHVLEISEERLIELFLLYKGEGLLKDQSYYYCASCSAAIYEVEKLERVTCDLCFRELSPDDQKTRFTLSRIVQQDIIQNSLYQPNKKLLLEKYTRFKKSKLKGVSNREKKEALEDLAFFLFDSVQGFRILEKDKLTSYGELDLVVENTIQDHPFLSVLHIGNMILVECKNWSEPAGNEQITYFNNKMKNSQTNFGVYFSRKGLSSLNTQALEFAKRTIVDAHSEGRAIIPITGIDIEKVALGKDFVDLLTERRQEIRLY